ncbi:MAG: response regulator [Magnetospiraceae bacterium]
MNRRIAFDRIGVVLIDPNNAFRRALRAGLNRMGFDQIREYRTLDEFAKSLSTSLPDLLLLNADEAELDVFEIVRAIRYHHRGENPFVPIICLTSDPTERRVLEAANSGTDHLLVKPISPAAIESRVRHMLDSRRLFVVTADYIGPDRRQGQRQKRSKVPLIEVPNVLSARIEGQDEDTIRAAIEATVAVFDAEKLSRSAERLVMLTETAVPRFERTGDKELILPDLQDIRDLAYDMIARLDRRSMGHVGELCHTLVEATDRFLGVAVPDHRDLDLMQPLSMAIQQAVIPASEEEAALAREIVVTIDGVVRRTGR